MGGAFARVRTPKPLLANDSLLYLRRLAKELNSLPDGFYYAGHRWTSAQAERSKFKNFDGQQLGMLYLRRRIDGNTTVVNIAPPDAISDAYGQPVYVSRKPPK